MILAELETEEVVIIDKDYDCTIEHYPERANIVGDVLSRKSFGSLADLRRKYLPLFVELRNSRVGLSLDDQGALLATLYIRPMLVERIIKAQMHDPLICTLRLEVENGTRTDYLVRNDGALIVGTRLYVPGDEALKREILEEAPLFGLHHASRQHKVVPYSKGVLLTWDNHDGVWVIVD
ncbi:hypothetical protein L3X38_010828 [Prunus dulcis]|uniref:Uncharacterized protein n=1 Tax=Prunus dulcis TaxID=3755 RepID=A0AAD4ZDP7_PRUDU|nr:hypothetical protein L3X38_010828 [Prunus dulcis]